MCNNNRKSAIFTSSELLQISSRIMCYVGKATKIFIFIVSVIIVTSLVVGFGILGRNINPKSSKCSGEYCSISEHSPPPPPLQFPFPSFPDPNPTVSSNSSPPPPPPLTSLPPPPPPPHVAVVAPPAAVTAAPPPQAVQVSPGPMSST